MADISVTELKERLDKGEDLIIVDVREQDEWQAGHITERHIPMGEVAPRIDELEPYKGQEIVVHCRSGKRSAAVVEVLKQMGFADPRNLAGGMLAWKEQIDPSFNV